MASSILPILFLALAVAKADPISYGCGTVPSDVPYQVAVGEITAYLFETTPSSGFSAGQLGDINGYVLCRGDVSEDYCFSCTDDAINEIHGLCPNSQQAAVYYDYCYMLLQVGQYSYDSNIYYCSEGGVHVVPVDQFEGILQYLFTSLRDGTPSQARFMVAGYIDITDDYRVYGYVQCFNNLSGDNCKACLSDVISQLPNSCTTGVVGGRLVAGSCLLRYEVYDFLLW